MLATQTRDGWKGARSINWFDPEKVSHIRTSINDAYRDCLIPQAPLMVGTDAEVIIEGVAAAADVWTRDIYGAGIGVRADPKGRAWFRGMEPRRYDFTCGQAQETVELKSRGASTAEKPGFNAVFHFRFGLTDNSIAADDVKGQQMRLAATENQIATFAESAETISTAAKLMRGELKEPPAPQTEGTEVKRLYTDKPLKISRAAGGKNGSGIRFPVVDLEPGHKYRISAEVKSNGISPMHTVRVGVMIGKAGGKTDWTQASFGKDPKMKKKGGDAPAVFDWTPIAFDYFYAHGSGKFKLALGIAGQGVGEVKIRNVVITRLR